MVEDTKLDQPAEIKTDQAEGLRSMFGDRAPRVVCVSCALDADTASTMTLGTAHALRQQGQRVLLIDEIPLQERRDIHGLAYPVRYDIAQVLENDIPLEKAICKAEENLWYATGLRMERSYMKHKLRHPSLIERIVKAKIELDLILLATKNPVEGVLRAYAHDIQHLVVCAPEEASMIHALEFIRSISYRTDGAKIPVLIIGGDAESAGQEAFDRLQQASQSLMEQPLESMGWIAAVTVPNSTKKTQQPAGLILPATLYAKLAGTTLQLT
jgi:MinD-like ATPase involved in chromosome partitioning or flagellar assembly